MIECSKVDWRESLTWLMQVVGGSSSLTSSLCQHPLSRTVTVTCLLALCGNFVYNNNEMHSSCFSGSSASSHWHFWLWVRDTMICACGKLFVESVKREMYRLRVIKHRAHLYFYFELISNGRRRWIASGWQTDNPVRGVERRRWIANGWQTIIQSSECSDIVCVGFCICHRCQCIKKN